VEAEVSAVAWEVTHERGTVLGHNFAGVAVRIAVVDENATAKLCARGFHGRGGTLWGLPYVNVALNTDVNK
jgi:hypothetical protein